MLKHSYIYVNTCFMHPIFRYIYSVNSNVLSFLWIFYFLPQLILKLIEKETHNYLESGYVILNDVVSLPHLGQKILNL